MGEKMEGDEGMKWIQMWKNGGEGVILSRRRGRKYRKKKNDGRMNTRWKGNTGERKETKTPWPESVSELYRPSNRYLLAKLVPTFEDRWCHVVRMTSLWP
jgi:hypothetical protein